MSILSRSPLVATARTALRAPSAGPSTQTRSATFSLGGLGKLFGRKPAERAEATTKDGENLYDDLIQDAALIPETLQKKVSTFVSPSLTFCACSPSSQCTHEMIFAAQIIYRQL